MAAVQLNEVVQWVEPSAGLAPSARNGHSLTVLPGKIVLIGGLVRKIGSANDVHVLDVASANWRWNSPSCEGAAPSERSTHSATAIDDTRVLVFGGQVCKTTLTLFNDVHVLDTTNWKWSAAEASGTVPSGRGRHTATLYDGKLYVFGGYGASNAVYNDLFCLDIESMTWSKPKTKGPVPKARFGHACALAGSKLFVFGGTAEHNEPLQDVACIDLDTFEWAEADALNMLCPEQLTKFSGVGVASAITHKLFLFGGQTRPMQYSNTVAYWCTETKQWRQVEASGRAPSPRADSPVVYEPKSQSLVMFGGWANEFLNDLHKLEVGSIVGPAYTVTGVDPSMGPVMNPIPITVRGVNFVQSTSIKVLFTNGQNLHVPVGGTFVSSTEISCTTPSFEAFGPSRIFIRVTCSGDQYTVPFDRLNYKLFLDTKAGNCFAWGPGVLAQGATGMETSFLIWAKDEDGDRRQSGGDKFTVAVQRLHDEEEAPELEIPLTPAKVEDNGDGTYFVAFTPEQQGNYTVSVTYADHHVRGSPFKVEFRDSLRKTQLPAGDAKYNFFPIMKARVPKLIQELEATIKKFVTTLGVNVKMGDLETLLQVMSCIDDVRKRTDLIDLQMDMLTDTTAWLKANGDVGASRHEKRITDLIKTWSDIKRDSPVKDKSLKGHKDKSRQTVQKDIEDFQTRIMRFRRAFSDRPFYTYSNGIVDSYDAILQGHMDVRNVEEESHRLSVLAELFDFTEMMVEPIQTIKGLRWEIVCVKHLWDLVMFMSRQFDSYKRTLWNDINTELMEEEVKKLPKELRGLDKSVRSSNTYTELNAELRTFQNSLPLIANLRHPSMKERHWKLLMETTKITFDMGPQFSLKDLMDLNLPKFEGEVDEIVDRAQKEEKMEATLSKIEGTWKVIEFQFNQHKDTDVFLVAIQEEDFETLEDQQVMVQNMIASKYLATYETEVMYWRKSLANVSDVMQLFVEIQQTWAYLEVLFIGSEEVQRELPDDTIRFRAQDVVVRDVLKRCKTVKNVVALCNEEGLLKKLQGVQEELGKCEKSLANYLENKRAAFPRFYFVSTADLLEILSNGNQPRKIMRHMSKIFQAVKRLQLDEQDRDGRPVAKAMDTSVGVEIVPLAQPLHLTGKVENYLTECIDAMQEAVRNKLTIAMRAYGSKARHEWLVDQTAQCMLVTTQIAWTSEVEEAMGAGLSGQKNALKDYNKKQIQQLVDLIKMVQGDLDRALRQKVMVLITLDTHARDVIADLAKNEVYDTLNFRWQSQLRQYYSASDRNCEIRIADARFAYGFEYLGNGPRLVITPLTDRIYITAAQSLHLKMGCAPAGPAGTGKTETTKDLASQCGKAVYVFNCSDQMDYQSMGNIYKGLAASGSWGCFDEFNRLIPEVLSVCSVQFKTVIDGIRGKKPTITLLDTTVKLDPTCGVFITMNPGYLGRSELPESLKALFRPITVVVPDLELICENMLMAEGFIEAKVLAHKFVTLYSLCRDLLSKQDHYDWGLRAIKSVLVVAGSFKRAEPHIPESDILMRALRDSNLAKIPQGDVPVFMGLISDLFPGVNLPRKVDERLETAVIAVCKEHKLDPEPTFMLKIAQLDELLGIRHCIFVIGSSGSGKSVVWSTLGRTWTKLGRPTMVRDLNPKAITPNELYGYIQLSTREWKDGLLSNQMRELGQMEDTNPKWIILDGDLDTNWIESMNSVMDDNKILTLASNERVPLLPHMRMIFEIRDLRFATPATVSRAGIIYCSDGKQWFSYAKSWLQRQEYLTPDARQFLSDLFEAYVPGTVDFMVKNLKHIINILPFNEVQTTCNILQGMFGDSKPTPELLADKNQLEVMFVFAMVWAFGGALAEKDGVDYRKKFSDWWKDNWKGVKFPPRGSIFDVVLDPETKTFQSWRDRVPKVEFNPDEPMSSLTVPTPETTSITFFMESLLNQGKAVMLVGNAGCGKTQLVLGKLKSLGEDMLSVIINLNYYTDSLALQRAMEVPLEKKAGRNYGPPGAKKLIYFVDDLNMPRLDAYNTQTPIALMRQVLDYGHWYDRNKLAYQNIRVIQNTQFVSAMNPTAGSFTVNPRLQRHFAVFAVDFPSQVSLMDIYRTFLTGHLASFSGAVQELKTKIIEATLMLHAKVGETFRKTAINFHYEFNIRHLSNVFQGLLMSRNAQFKDDEGPARFVELWMHECERVYSDRLVSGADQASYRRIAKQAYSKYFSNYSLDAYFREKDAPLLVFSHFARGVGEKVYDKFASFDRLKNTLEDSLNEYNEENAQMNLLLFEDALKHVCRISRIIENSSGHALLVGVGGSGKQSLSRLAAYVSGYSVFQITISSSYGMADLREDLKSLYIRSGLKDEGIVFMFTDSQITDERFLVYINDLLSSGDIPDLFPTDEKDNVVNSIRAEVKGAGIVDTRESCWEFFLQKVKRNLHVVLCFSPVGEPFRIRPRRFPALVNCTVIDWFHPWPEDALLGVARRFLASVDLGEDNVRDGVIKFMPYAFKVVNDVSARYLESERRHNYTTPKSFLGVIDLYKSMLSKRRNELTRNIERLQSGLQKLEKTARDVAVLEEDLKIKSVEVEEKKESADAFAEQVGREKAKVEAETAKANIEAEKANKIQTEVSEKQRQCAVELAEAEPAVERAKAALDTVTKKDLSETKALKSPPAGVDDVTHVVYVLLNQGKPIPKKPDWKQHQQMMNKVDQFLVQLRSFKNEIDEQRVSDKNFEAVRQYLDLPHFNSKTMEKKSKAAAGLCEFAINIVMYYDIVRKVEPLRMALAQAEQQLADANSALESAQTRVAELTAQLNQLIAEFDKATAEKNAVIAEAERCQNKLNLAQRLVKAVGSEQVRWAANVDSLNADLDVVVGDVLLGASFVSYIGGFSKPFRDELIGKYWIPYLREHQVPLSATTDILKILTTEAAMATWMSQELPSDRLSMENGVIVTSCERWPLMIDPQLQGIKWIKEKEAKNSLVVLRLNTNRMLNKLEMAISNGHSVLIENLGESIDAVLQPVIGRQTIKKLGILYVKLGDHEVEYHKNFRLFLHTKLSNPHYPPEIQAETTLINFTVTEDGLEDQLLAVVVQKERPDLEAQKARLIQEQLEFKIKLSNLEDDLLKKLATAEGDLTEDVGLIENLEDMKRISDDIKEKMRIATETEVKINKTREFYRPVATRGSLLFFLLMTLRKINPFYQYSLAAFIVVFLRGIDRLLPEAAPALDEAADGDAAAPADDAEPAAAPAAAAAAGAADEQEVVLDDSLARRISGLVESITFTVLQYTRRGLFEKHKLIVATQLCFKILSRRGDIDERELDYLIQGKKAANPPPMGERLQQFLSQQNWSLVHALCELPSFSALADDLGKFAPTWEKWCNEEKPEQAELPHQGHGQYKWNTLTRFQTLLVVRALRPDRITSALYDFVESSLGRQYVEQEPFDLVEIFRESDRNTPMFFVLFPGAQPLKDIEALAGKLDHSQEKGNLATISMGQGQEKVAEGVLDKYTAQGGWVFLDNVHLMQRWLSVFESKMELAWENGVDEFRCFYSAEYDPTPDVKTVPESVIQASIKIVNEPLQSLKANLLRALQTFSNDHVDSCNKPDKMKVILFSLCFFHAVVLGRRKFGSQGWSRFYSFNVGDLSISGDVLRNYLNVYEEVPWDDLRYMFGEIMYGGHITDGWDRRTCSTYLAEYMRPELLQEGFSLAPKFNAPGVGDNLQYYMEYVEKALPRESPLLFGMHPNAEIGFLSAEGDTLFSTILDLAGAGGSGAGSTKRDQVLMELINDLLERVPQIFKVLDISQRIEEKTPFLVVMLQEIERMNRLLAEITRSLLELRLGLQGALNISEAMESLANSLFLDRVPGPWTSLAYPSLKSLGQWFSDLLRRVTQLTAWSDALKTPKVVWISGFFNPMAFLTAVMQVTARLGGFPLDNMTLEEQVLKTPLNEIEEAPDDGAYIHGLYLEGARWDEDEAALADQHLKQLHPPLPVMHVTAVTTEEKIWEGMYSCPVYMTAMRGPTFVLTATLKTNDPSNKWVLRGVALLMSDD